MNSLARVARCLLVLLVFSQGLFAKDFVWFPMGDGSSFSDPGNWYDLDPNVDPHNPAGPPGAGDNAQLISDATVVASGGSVNALLGGGAGITFTANGSFSAGGLDTTAVLKGSGLFTAQTVLGIQSVDGGNLKAISYLHRSVTVKGGGSVVIESGVQPATIGETFNFFAEGSGTSLEVKGPATMMEGNVEAGATATFASIDSDMDTFTIGVSDGTLEVTGDCRIRGGFLAASLGATINVGGALKLEPRLLAFDSSSWFGAGTQVSAVKTEIGLFDGTFQVDLSDDAVFTSATTMVGSTEFSGAGRVRVQGGAEFNGGNCTVGYSGEIVVKEVGSKGRTVSLTIDGFGEGGLVSVESGADWDCTGTTIVSGFGQPGPELRVTGDATFRSGVGLGLFDGRVNLSTGGRVAVGPNSFGAPNTVRVNSGGRLFGDGTVMADEVIVLAGGTVETFGTLALTKGYEQQFDGELLIDIGGGAIGAREELLKVGGQADLGGRLIVTPVPGFDFSASPGVTVLEATSILGTFDEVVGGTAVYTATSVIVVPTGDPDGDNLTLDVAPPEAGSVTDGFLGVTPRNLGESYTIKAKAAKGFVFAGWTGSLVSAEATLTFTMTPGMTLTANFVENPFDAAVLGAYEGLGNGNSTAGLLRLALTRGGNFTAKFLLPDGMVKFAGQFNGAGVFTRSLTIDGRTVEVSLVVDLNGAGELEGSIVIDGVSYSVDGDRTAFSEANPTDRAGRYTMLFSPGNGWATGKISAAGNVKLSGKLADGTPFTAAGLLAADGSYDLFVPLYARAGWLLGTLTLAAPPRDPGASDVGGTLTWGRPGVGPANLGVEGSLYTKPGEGERALPGLDAAGDAQLTFTGGDLAGEVVKGIQISLGNDVTYPAPASPDDKLTLKFKAKSGALKGTFLHPALNQIAPFSGVVLEKQVRGAGFFSGAANSGQVELAP